MKYKLSGLKKTVKLILTIVNLTKTTFILWKKILFILKTLERSDLRHCLAYDSVYSSNGHCVVVVAVVLF